MTPSALLFKASILITIAAVAQACVARRTSAATRHLIWVLAILGLLLLPMLASVLPRWTAVRLGASETTAAAPLVESPTSSAAVVGTESAGPSALLAADAAEAPRPAPIALVIPWSSALPALYGAGVVLLLARFTVERASIQRLARRAHPVTDPEWMRLLLECADRMGVRRMVSLVRSREQTIPMTFGTWRGTILIPAVADTWSQDRRRAVLLHELAHIARYDCLTQMFGAVACALYWIHPGVWWMSRRLRAEQELACDDRVLATGTNARDYAGHLLELAYTLRGDSAPVFAVNMAHPRQLEGRMLAVLDAARNRATPTLHRRLAAVAIMAALLVPVAAATTSVEPAGSNDQAAPSGTITDAAREQPTVASESRGSAVGSQGLPGTWEMTATREAGKVQLRLIERGGFFRFTIEMDRLDGLSNTQLASASGPVKFSLRRDAGTFSFEGALGNGVGAGTYTFAPSADFRAALANRGFERPAFEDQLLLARGDIGLAFLDELAAQGYTRPHLAQVVRAAQHGVSLDYLREMGSLGYRLGLVEALVVQRDHGVSPQFIRELVAEGLPNLTPDDLVRARDHGVGSQYIRELRELGYAPLSLDGLVRARDHGVSPEYIRALGQLGLRLTLDELIRARDHGVSPQYVEELRTLGYAELSLDRLVGARDHGVSPEYIRDLRQLGYQLTLDDLIKARDHGVSADYIRALTALGYEQLSLDDLIRLRDHGVTAEYVRELDKHSYGRPSIAELVQLRDQGLPSDGFRRAIDRMWQVNMRQFGWHVQCASAWVQQVLNGGGARGASSARSACTTR